MCRRWEFVRATSYRNPESDITILAATRVDILNSVGVKLANMRFAKIDDAVLVD